MPSYDTVQSIFDRLQEPGFQRKTFAYLTQKHSFADLDRDTLKLTTFLQSKGCTLGDRVVLASSDYYLVGMIFLACLRNGVCPVMVDPDLGPIRAMELIDLATPKGFFLDPEVQANWNIDPSDDQFVQVLTKQKRRKGALLKKLLSTDAGSGTEASSFQDILKNLTPGKPPAFFDPSTPAYILFTSGSTARSKAVQISHQALWSNLKTIKKVYQLDEDARIFNILTVYHTDGLMQGPVLAALLGATWYHPFDFEVSKVERIFDAMYKFRITHFITVPTMLAFLNRFSAGYEDSFDTPEFKYIVTSAAPFEPDLWQQIEDTFKVRVINNYGLTETVAGASYTGPHDDNHKIGSIGKPIDCTFQLVDEQDQILSENQVGELWIKGENLLSEYLNNEEATRAAFSGAWFKTGDLASRDEAGFYFLKGRKKNLIIAGGINIQPEEVMSVLNRHPAVLESACVGVADPIFGEKPVAAVVLESRGVIAEADLIAHCRTELEPAKIPAEIHFLEALPKTGSGKIKYAEVHEWIKTRAHDNAQEDFSNVRSKILAAAASAFKIPSDQIEFLNASSMTIEGWDSMAHLAFITDLEDRFQLRFNSKEVMNMVSLPEAEQILNTKMKA